MLNTLCGASIVPFELKPKKEINMKSVFLLLAIAMLLGSYPFSVVHAEALMEENMDSQFSVESLFQPFSSVNSCEFVRPGSCQGTVVNRKNCSGDGTDAQCCCE